MGLWEEDLAMFRLDSELAKIDAFDVYLFDDESGTDLLPRAQKDLSDVSLDLMFRMLEVSTVGGTVEHARDWRAKGCGGEFISITWKHCSELLMELEVEK